MTAITIEQVLREGSARLKDSGSDLPLLDCSLLLCHVLDCQRTYLLTWPEKLLTAEQAAQYSALLARREAGEPIAYILGQREFWSLPLKVSPSTLIPRPDTERLVEVALDKANGTDGDLLDLGTGTGAIALALASEFPKRHVVGVDYQQDAVRLALENAQQLNITNVEFRQSDWFKNLNKGTKFAVIVSNPPYIDEDDPHLAQGDVRFEPLTALVAPENGLADIQHIIKHAPAFLVQNGWLMFEHGFEQGQAVRDALNASGFMNVETQLDYAGLERVTLGQYVL